MRLRIGQCSVKCVGLGSDLIDRDVLIAGILVGRAQQRYFGKIVVDLENDFLRKIRIRSALSRNLDLLATSAQPARRIAYLGVLKVESEVLNFFAGDHDSPATCRSLTRIIEREALTVAEECRLQVSRGQ